MEKIKKWIYVWMLPLAIAGVSGCSDDDAVEALAEPVPLTMSLSSTDLVMGETLDITFTVTGTEEGKTSMNEDLNITMSATTENGAVDQLVFSNFPSVVTLEKGITSKTVSVNVVEEGLNTERSVEISAFARGYRQTNFTQTVTVSDYRYVTVSLKNNSDNSVTEGQTFILVASITTAVDQAINVTVTPKSGEEDQYENLPSTLTIPAGQTSVESDEVTILHDEVETGNETLTLRLTSDNEDHPTSSKKIEITKVDIDGGLGSQITDERWLYADPDQLFVSSKNQAAVQSWGKRNVVVMNEGDPHPNNGGALEAGKWKFWRAYEFHKISSCLTTKNSNDGVYTSTEHPLGFADQNTSAVETAGAVDNAKYSWVTDDGYLRMIALKETAKSSNTGKTFNFGTSAFYANKFMRENSNSTTWASSNIRIYPGMRIETRARIRGADQSGMLPGIWLQGNEQVGGNSTWNNWPDFGEIDVMENNTQHSNVLYRTGVEQTFHFGTLNSPGASTNAGKYNPTYAVTEIAGTIGDFHIYWMEWIDNETVAVGVNGSETRRVTKTEVESAGASWPFTYDVNSEGLYYILTMMFLHKAEPTSTTMEMSYAAARNILKSNPSDERIPRMDIDWVRFWIDDTYRDHDMDYRDDIILY